MEFSDTEFNLNADEFNQQVQNFDHPAFAQLIFKYTEQELKIITAIPKTGVYQLKNQQLTFIRYADNPRQLADNEIFILRILSTDEYVYKGADTIILFVNELLQDEHNKLTEFAENIIAIVHKAIQYRELTDEEQQLTQRYAGHASLKTSEDSE